MRKGWTVVWVAGLAIILGGSAAGCGKHDDRGKVIKVEPERRRDIHIHQRRDNHDGHDRRVHRRDDHRRDDDREHKRRKDPRRHDD